MSATWKAELYREEATAVSEDPLRAARGIVYGILLSAFIWAVLGYALWRFI